MILLFYFYFKINKKRYYTLTTNKITFYFDKTTTNTSVVFNLIFIFICTGGIYFELKKKNTYFY